MYVKGNSLNTLFKGNKQALFIAFVVSILVFSLSIVPVAVYAEDPKPPVGTRGSVSVGVVNVTYIMENAPQAEVASNMLKSKFLPQEKALAEGLEVIQRLEAALEKSAKNLSVSKKRQRERELRAKKRARTRSLQDFREELRFARDSALDDVQKEVFQAIGDVRAQNGIDIVIQDYIAASKRVDITSLVLAHLNEKLEKALVPKAEDKE